MSTGAHVVYEEQAPGCVDRAANQARAIVVAGREEASKNNWGAKTKTKDFSIAST